MKEEIDNKNTEYLATLKKGKEGNSAVSKSMNMNEERSDIGDLKREEDFNKLSVEEAQAVKAKMKEFYEKMLEERLDKGDDKQDDCKNKENNNVNQSMLDNNRMNQDTTMCSQYSRDYKKFGETIQVNLKRKENPCLKPNTEIK